MESSPITNFIVGIKYALKFNFPQQLPLVKEALALLE